MNEDLQKQAEHINALKSRIFNVENNPMSVICECPQCHNKLKRLYFSEELGICVDCAHINKKYTKKQPESKCCNAPMVFNFITGEIECKNCKKFV
jgi:hypothetical protein